MRNLLLLALLLLISGFLIIPLAREGMVLSDDGSAHLLRQESLYHSLKEGILLPRWAPDLNFGFGSPVFLYNWLLPYYIGSLGRLAGLGEIAAFKFTLAIGVPLSALFCYLWLKNLPLSIQVQRGTTRITALTGALLYTLVPYRVMTVYERGTPGETWLSVFPPLILWLTNKGNWGKTLLPIAWAGMFLTHSVGAFIMTPFILLLMFKNFGFKNSFKIENLKLKIAPMCMGLLLAAFNWLPAALELPHLTNYYNFLVVPAAAEHFRAASALFQSYPPANFISLFINGPRSTALGLAIPLVLLLALSKWAKLGIPGKIGIGVIALCFFLMSSLAAPIWHLRIFQLLQFPWRLVNVIILVSTYLTVWLLCYSTSYPKNKHVLSALLISIACLSIIPMMTSKPRTGILPSAWVEKTAPDVIGEYLPKGLTYDKLKTLVQTTPPGDWVIDDQWIGFNQLYFPRWKAYAYDVELPILSDHPGREGLITVKAPPSLPVQSIQFRFEETNIRRVGFFMSLAAFFWWLGAVAKVLKHYFLLQTK